MKIHQLDVFLAVAQYRSIRAAARAKDISQSAVTKIVKDFELDLGVDLVSRSHDGIALTAYGQHFAERAEIICREVVRTREEISRLQADVGGVVTIGITPVVAVTSLSEALAAFDRQRPEAQVRVLESNMTNAVERLRAGRLDFAIVHIVSDNALDAESDLLVTPLRPSEFVVGCRVGHPLERSRSLRELAQEKWCVPVDGEHFHRFLSTAYGGAGMALPKRFIVCNSFTIALHIVAESDAMGYFTASMSQAEFKKHGLRRIAVTERLPSPMLAIVRRKNHKLPLAASLFCDQFLRIYQRDMAAPALPVPV